MPEQIPEERDPGHPAASFNSLLGPFFASRGWSPFPFQEEAIEAYLQGSSGLLHAPTGLGKTLAAYLGPVAEAILEERRDRHATDPGARILWLTPLRALAKDTLRSLREPLEELGVDWSVEARTGDTSSYKRAKLRERLPFCLVTTPESLSLMLTYEDFQSKLANLRCVIIDEWHELLGSKRGVQTELCLARLRRWLPKLRVWGLSATLGNLQEAAGVLYPGPAGGQNPNQPAPPFVTISGDLKKRITVSTILPRNIERFPWSGHIGTSLVRQVAQQIKRAETTLLFTNTRSQTEIWFQALLEVRPKWKDQIGVHHGSLDLEERALIEERLRTGDILCVVCTSSLDLGVDFSPVDQVIQVGSPKGIARLLQRAGRSGHQPGKLSKIVCVPTNALELVEFAAARDAMEAKEIEARIPLRKPLDVLVQHLVTVIIGRPDKPEDLRREMESTFAFSNLSESEWEWALGFITTGGKALAAYPNYRKAAFTEDGRLTVTDKRRIQLHRMSIGTITSDLAVTVRFQNGRVLGTVEEGFVSRMKPGEQFIFAGRRLELVSLRNQTAAVRAATRQSKGRVAIWGGSRMSLSNELANSVARRLHQPVEETSETSTVAPVLAIQREWSQLPSRSLLLIEHTHTDEGEHLFVYPMAGRLVHEGLGALCAFRLSRDSEATIQVSMNDYGFALHSASGLPLEEEPLRLALSADNLLEDLLSCLNTVELARRKFREIARVAGLVLQNFPGRRQSNRDLHTSSSLLYDVFRSYDPDNLLLAQAECEILEQQLELTRLKSTMEDLADRPAALVNTTRLSPFAFPLWADRLQAITAGRDYATRLERMLTNLERAAGQTHLPDANSASPSPHLHDS